MPKFKVTITLSVKADSARNAVVTTEQSLVAMCDDHRGANVKSDVVSEVKPKGAV